MQLEYVRREQNGFGKRAVDLHLAKAGTSLKSSRCALIPETLFNILGYPAKKLTDLKTRMDELMAHLQAI